MNRGRSTLVLLALAAALGAYIWFVEMKREPASDEPKTEKVFTALEADGIAAEDANDLLCARGIDLDFGFERRSVVPRPSSAARRRAELVDRGGDELDVLDDARAPARGHVLVDRDHGARLHCRPGLSCETGQGNFLIFDLRVSLASNSK